MRKEILTAVSLFVLAGCAGAGRHADDLSDMDAMDRAAAASPSYALPGVPLQKAPRAAAAAPAALPGFSEEESPAAVPAPAPAAAPAAAQKPAAPAAARKHAAPQSSTASAALPDQAPAAAAGKSGDLDFHVASAKKYFAGKKYRSAAAEYKAALPYLPSGDPREVNLLERQGAMDLKAGLGAKAKALFLSAISRASELGVSGEDLANAHVGLGYCLEKENDKDGAAEHYRKAAAITSSRQLKARLNGAIKDLKKGK